MTDLLDEIHHKKNLIKQQRCFSELTESEIEVLATLLIKKHIPKGTIIVTEGDHVDGFYLISKGIAEVHSRSEAINILKADQYDSIGLNETGFYSLSGLRTATVISADDMIVYYVSLPLFHGFVLNYPHVSQVMREQAERFLKSPV